jgi:hypothetical protein
MVMIPYTTEKWSVTDYKITLHIAHCLIYIYILCSISEGRSDSVIRCKKIKGAYSVWPVILMKFCTVLIQNIKNNP